MPHQLKWLPQGIIWTFTGKVTTTEILQRNMKIHGSERFDALRYEIADFTGAEGYEATRMEVRRIAYLGKAAAKSNPRVKVAIVAPDETNEYLVEYLTHAREGPWKTEVFQSLEDAKNWVLEETGILSEQTDSA
jgi:hypothetical protein